MGIFNSFKGQIGRDAGRALSNFVWGDKHSSPYRRVEGKKKKELELKEKELGAAIVDEDEKHIFRTEQLINEKISVLMSLEIPETEKQAFIKTLNDLIFQIEANPFKSILDDENRVTNRYSEVLLIKYNQVLRDYRMNFQGDTKHYEKYLSKFYKRKFVGKYSVILLFVGFILICALPVWLKAIKNIFM